MEDALDELFVEEEKAISNELLRDLLKDYLQLTAEGKVFTLPAYHDLKSIPKILLILLAKKVLSIKLGKEELTSPKEIQEITGLPRGTVNPTLTDLASRRLINNKGGKYFVPGFAISKVQPLLGKSE